MSDKKKHKIRISFELIAIMLLFALALTFFATFLMAYFNGKQILVAVDSFSEANIELVLFSAVIILGFILIVIKTKELKLVGTKNEKKAE